MRGGGRKRVCVLTYTRACSHTCVYVLRACPFMDPREYLHWLYSVARISVHNSLLHHRAHMPNTPSAPVQCMHAHPRLRAEPVLHPCAARVLFDPWCTCLHACWACACARADDTLVNEHPVYKDRNRTIKLDRSSAMTRHGAPGDLGRMSGSSSSACGCACLCIQGCSL